jgi:hypothetical protein
VDETMIKVGSLEYVRLWVIIEHKDKEILSITTYLKRERSICLCLVKFLSKVVEKYASHLVSQQTMELGIHRKSMSIFKTTISFAFHL